MEVDREFVTALGTRVDPERQEIRVDGVLLRKQRRVYYLVHKPPGVVSTTRDQAGRQRVVDLVPRLDGLFTVGRLDMSSEGAILVTNDGDLANLLTHPRYGIAKTYHVEVAGRIDVDMLRQLRQGIYLAEAFVRMADVRIRRRSKSSTILEVVLREGRNREIRRMLARVGHKVLRLRRVAVGPLRLGELPSGAFRLLDAREVRALRAAVETGNKSRGKRRPYRKSSHKSSAPRTAEKPGGRKRAAADRSSADGTTDARSKKRPATKSAGKRTTNRKTTGHKSVKRKTTGQDSSKRKHTKRKTTGHKPVKRKTTGQDSSKRKHTKRTTVGQKSVKRKTDQRRSVGKKSVNRKTAKKKGRR